MNDTFFIAADLKYIMAFKSTATKETFAKARKDIEEQGGKVTYEFHSAMNGIEFTFPNEQVTALREKAYVDFIEQDKTGKKKTVDENFL